MFGCASSNCLTWASNASNAVCSLPGFRLTTVMATFSAAALALGAAAVALGAGAVVALGAVLAAGLQAPTTRPASTPRVPIDRRLDLDLIRVAPLLTGTMDDERLVDSGVGRASGGHLRRG